MANLHGTCGNCGGPVVTDQYYCGFQKPYCQKCGARVANAYGRMLPMEKPEKKDPLEVLAAARTATAKLEG
jgi:hypothetical protein